MEASFDQQKWDDLVAFKLEKIKEQNEIVAAYKSALNDHDGLVENSRLVMKNLHAAIATAKQPGYFKYHESSDRVKKIEDRGEIKSFNQRINQIQKEIDHAASEMAEMDRRRRQRLENGNLPAVGSLAQWFVQYGGKPRQIPAGGVTEFIPSSKIYGGTKHHPAFKSLSSGMRRGTHT